MGVSSIGSGFKIRNVVGPKIKKTRPVAQVYGYHPRKPLYSYIQISLFLKVTTCGKCSCFIFVYIIIDDILWTPSRPPYFVWGLYPLSPGFMPLLSFIIFVVTQYRRTVSIILSEMAGAEIS